MIHVRAATPADAEAIAAIYAPHVRTGTASFELESPDAAAMAARIASSDGHYPWLVATDGETPDGSVIGYAYASRFRDRPAYRYVVETSIYMADTAQRRGTGRLLYGALIATASAQGFVQALAVIVPSNVASIALHESLGFRRAGMFREIGFKHGQWVDLGFWQRPLNVPQTSPVEPRRFADTGVVHA